MRKNLIYESENGVIVVKPNITHGTEDDLAYITIFAGSGKIHVNASLIDELLLLLATVLEDFNLVTLELTDNPTNKKSPTQS